VTELFASDRCEVLGFVVQLVIIYSGDGSPKWNLAVVYERDKIKHAAPFQ